MVLFDMVVDLLLLLLLHMLLYIFIKSCGKSLFTRSSVDVGTGIILMSFYKMVKKRERRECDVRKLVIYYNMICVYIIYIYTHIYKYQSFWNDDFFDEKYNNTYMSNRV